MARVKGTGNDISFTADSDRVEQVWPSGAISGYVGMPCLFGIHSIECPPLEQYFSLTWDYLFKSKDASVQYLRAGKRLSQLVAEQVWAWGMGRPCSKHTTHVEQTGYASMSTPQWSGDPSAVGSYFTQPNGNRMLYTEEMAQCMRDQMDGLAGDYADWCHRHGFTPHWADQDEVIRGSNGEPVGGFFFHYQASEVPGTTTTHTDPGKGRYPKDLFLQKALDAFNGRDPITPVVVKPTPEPTPTPEPEGLTMDAEVKKAFTDLTKAVQGIKPSPAAPVTVMLFKNYNGGIGVADLVANTWRGVHSPAQLALYAGVPRYQNLANRIPAATVVSLFGKQVG